MLHGFNRESDMNFARLKTATSPWTRVHTTWWKVGKNAPRLWSRL